MCGSAWESTRASGQHRRGVITCWRLLCASEPAARRRLSMGLMTAPMSRIAAANSDLTSTGDLLKGSVMTSEMRWAAIAAFFLLALGVLAHALVPRYDYAVSSDGS